MDSFDIENMEENTPKDESASTPSGKLGKGFTRVNDLLMGLPENFNMGLPRQDSIGLGTEYQFTESLNANKLKTQGTMLAKGEIFNNII